MSASKKRTPIDEGARHRKRHRASDAQPLEDTFTMEGLLECIKQFGGEDYAALRVASPNVARKLYTSSWARAFGAPELTELSTAILPYVDIPSLPQLSFFTQHEPIVGYAMAMDLFADAARIRVPLGAADGKIVPKKRSEYENICESFDKPTAILKILEDVGEKKTSRVALALVSVFDGRNQHGADAGKLDVQGVEQLLQSLRNFYENTRRLSAMLLESQLSLVGLFCVSQTSLQYVRAENYAISDLFSPPAKPTSARLLRAIVRPWHSSHSNYPMSRVCDALASFAGPMPLRLLELNGVEDAVAYAKAALTSASHSPIQLTSGGHVLYWNGIHDFELADAMDALEGELAELPADVWPQYAALDAYALRRKFGWLPLLESLVSLMKKGEYAKLKGLSPRDGAIHLLDSLRALVAEADRLGLRYELLPLLERICLLHRDDKSNGGIVSVSSLISKRNVAHLARLVTTEVMGAEEFVSVRNELDARCTVQWGYMGYSKTRSFVSIYNDRCRVHGYVLWLMPDDEIVRPTFGLVVPPNVACAQPGETIASVKSRLVDYLQTLRDEFEEHQVEISGELARIEVVLREFTGMQAYASALNVAQKTCNVAGPLSSLENILSSTSSCDARERVARLALLKHCVSSLETSLTWVSEEFGDELMGVVRSVLASRLGPLKKAVLPELCSLITACFSRKTTTQRAPTWQKKSVAAIKARLRASYDQMEKVRVLRNVLFSVDEKELADFVRHNAWDKACLTLVFGASGLESDTPDRASEPAEDPFARLPVWEQLRVLHHLVSVCKREYVPWKELRGRHTAAAYYADVISVAKVSQSVLLTLQAISWHCGGFVACIDRLMHWKFD